MNERIVQNGLNYRCERCGARGREIPVCVECVEEDAPQISYDDDHADEWGPEAEPE